MSFSNAIAVSLAILLASGFHAEAVPVAGPASSVESAKDANSKVDSTRVANDPLIVTATGDPMNRVGQPAFVTVNIKNSAGDDVLLKNINITIDNASSDRFVGSVSCGLQQRGEIALVRDQSFEQSCRFEMRTTDLAWTFKAWQDALLAAEVRLAVTADINGLGEYRYYPSVSVKAREISIFIGGVAGALLLAIFVWIQRMLMDPAVREAWIASILFALLMGLRGGIMAIIALLLSKTTQGTGSPVSLTVVDFIGGVLIGLFSYPLASWISSALKLDDVFVPAEKKNDTPRKADAGSPEPVKDNP